MGDKNTAYERSHVFPVTQAALFEAFIKAATLKDLGTVKHYR